MSKVIVSENYNKHKSRLIKAIQSVNLEEYTNIPEGVWDCKAIIECNGISIKSAELDLEFDVPFDDNLEADEGEIIVYNLSNTTKNAWTVGSTITIKAGYNNDIGTIFVGTIQKVNTKSDGADKATTIKIKDDIVKATITEMVSAGKLEGTYSKASASTILSDLLKAEGSTYEFPTPPHDYNYENDVTLNGELESEIKKYAEVCGVSVFKIDGTLYAVNISGEGTDLISGEPFELNEETGLIGSPEPFEETIATEGYEDTYKGVEAEMLLNHTIKVTRQVRLKSEQHNGIYAVKSGHHSFDGTTCVTKIKAVQKFGYTKTEEEGE